MRFSLYAVLLSAWMALPLQAETTLLEVTVEAGDHDRTDVPVSIPVRLPANFSEVTTVDLSGQKGVWPVGQLTPLGLKNRANLADTISTTDKVDRELHLVISKLPAGESLFLPIGISTESKAKVPETAFRWGQADGKSQTLYRGEIPVMQYAYEALNTATPEDRERTYKPYHHLYDPLGRHHITKGPGGKFTHHRGLFYGFNKITYGDKQTADVWHATNGAYQEHKDFVQEVAGPLLGRQTVIVAWHGQDGKVFAEEERELTVYNLSTNPGKADYAVEFASQLNSKAGTIKLDGDPQHAGFQFRAAQDVAETFSKETYYIRPDGVGKKGEFINWDHRNPGSNAPNTINQPWKGLSFITSGDRYTVSYLDHPKNPKDARYSERDYGRFGSYFEAEVTEEKPLLVNYRVVVEQGEVTPEEIAAYSAGFATPPLAKLTPAGSYGKNTPPPGFIALFNGQDLSGWKGLVENPPARHKMSPEELAAKQVKADERMRAHWKVVDGEFVFDGKGDSLCTDKDYGDFEMYVDWKILKDADSGIYTRGSPQIQIWDRPDLGSGGLYNNQKHPSNPLVVADNPIGQWNTFYIKMVGEHVQVYLNDKLVTDTVLENYWERDKPIYPVEQIELQNHGNTLWFKNIYLRDLSK